MLSFSSSLWMFRALHHDLVNLYWISVSQLPRYAPFVLSISLSCLNSWFIIAFVARAGCTSCVWTTYTSGAPELTTGVKWDSPCPIFSFLRSILWIVVYPFVPFPLDIVLYVFWFTDSDNPFGTFKLLLWYFFVFLLDFTIVPTLWYFLFFC